MLTSSAPVPTAVGWPRLSAGARGPRVRRVGGGGVRHGLHVASGRQHRAHRHLRRGQLAQQAAAVRA
jgi:hypothetical protein